MAKIKTAGDSIVVARDGLKQQKQKLRGPDIADYNRIDCVSTAKCLDWLLTLRPAESSGSPRKSEEDPDKTTAYR